MGKSESCKKECSSSSSSSSSSCSGCEVKCERDCKKKDCDKSCFDCESPEKIICKKYNAVVNIHAEYILVGTGITTGASVAAAPLATGSRADIIVDSQGFFVKGHYIITTASSVFMPPSITSSVNRYPFITNPPLAINGSMYNATFRASRILVDVYNVNNRKCSFVYEADIVGADLAANFAVLKINQKKQWNACNPCIEKCHPYFKWSNSRKNKRGTKAYILGDVAASNKNGSLQNLDVPSSAPLNYGRYTNGCKMITAGVICDNRYVDHSGWLLHESIVTDAVASKLCQGGPILNCEGHVIGIVAGNINNVINDLDSGIPLTVGPSEFFVRRSFKTILKGKANKRANKYLVYVNDNAGTYSRYIKGYLGVGYQVMNGADFDYTTDYTGGSVTFPAGQPRIRLDAQGLFVSTPEPTCVDKSVKVVSGLRVVSVAGSSSTGDYYFTPGTSNAAAPLPNVSSAYGGLPADSPLLNMLVPGDIILSIDKVELGDGVKEIAPSLITWRIPANDRINVVYTRGGNLLNTVNPNTNAGNYRDTTEIPVDLVEFPPLLDFPWYAVQNFPLITYYGFTLPVNQIQDPQVPSTTTLNFQPAF